MELQIDTINKKYPVYLFEKFCSKELSEWFKKRSTDQAFLIMDENVERIYGKGLMNCFNSFIPKIHTSTIPEGETNKNSEQWLHVTDFLLSHNIRRNQLVIAVGGGVTGDLAGFAASTTLRGVSLIHLPTTLLAMVDSSIGGKTGINHSTGKNLVGSFYQPDAVFVATEFLTTLPDREWANGVSEILKYGAIKDRSIFEYCYDVFVQQSENWRSAGFRQLIGNCIRIKADIVEKDERDSGVRMFLNFGHTFAHAIENLGGYNLVSHGEAVFIGMIAAAKLSNEAGAALDLNKLERFLPFYDIDPGVSSLQIDELITQMQRDKKRTSEKLKLVLLHDWEHPYVTEKVNRDAVAGAWRYLFNLLNA